MLDVVSHETLQDDLKQHASLWHCLKAGTDIADQLPERPGLYMFVWCAAMNVYMADATERNFHQILYIGQAGGSRSRGNTIRNRFKDYRKYLRGEPESLWAGSQLSRRDDHLSHYLALRPLEYWFATVANQDMIPSLEQRMIELYNPPGNIQGRPRLRVRPQPPRPALRN
jgi:hypothetical protein